MPPKEKPKGAPTKKRMAVPMRPEHTPSDEGRTSLPQYSLHGLLAARKMHAEEFLRQTKDDVRTEVRLEEKLRKSVPTKLKECLSDNMVIESLLEGKTPFQINVSPSSYGFKNVDALNDALVVLQHAWKGNVSVDLSKRTDRTAVIFSIITPISREA